MARTKRKVSSDQLQTMQISDYDSLAEFKRENMRKEDWITLAEVNDVDFNYSDRISLIQEKIWEEWERRNLDLHPNRPPVIDNQAGGQAGAQGYTQNQVPQAPALVSVQPGNLNAVPPVANLGQNAQALFTANRLAQEQAFVDMQLQQQRLKLLNEEAQRDRDRISSASFYDAHSAIVNQPHRTHLPQSGSNAPISHQAQSMGVNTSRFPVNQPSTFNPPGTSINVSDFDGASNKPGEMQQNLASMLKRLEGLVQQQENAATINSIKYNRFRNLKEAEALMDILSFLPVGNFACERTKHTATVRLMFVTVMDQFGAAAAEKYQKTYTDEDFNTQWSTFSRNNGHLTKLPSEEVQNSLRKQNRDNYSTPPRKLIPSGSTALSPLMLYTPPQVPQHMEYAPVPHNWALPPVSYPGNGNFNGQLSNSYGGNHQQAQPSQVQLSNQGSPDFQAFMNMFNQQFGQTNSTVPQVDQNQSFRGVPVVNEPPRQNVTNQTGQPNGGQYFYRVDKNDANISQEFPIARSVTCFKCKELGHYANRCPNPPPNKE